MARAPIPESDGDPSSSGGEELATKERPQPIEAEDSTSFRVLVTGADGFLGRHLLPRLLSRGHRVRATCREGLASPGSEEAGVEWRQVDLTNRDSVTGIAAGCDRVVHLAGRFVERGGTSLGREHGTGTRNLVWEILKTDVERIVFVSALGASPDAGEFFRTKFEAEDVVMSADVDFVILRPSVVYGPGDHFTSPVVRILDALPVFPMLGDGTFELQPLAVEDMVDVMTQAVESPDLACRSFNLAGPERLSFVRIVRILGETIGRPRPIVPLPAALARPASRVAALLGLPSPFSAAQLDVLRFGSVLPTDENPVRSVFNLKPLPFADAVTDYLEPA
jgi:NADH dehydrogenase